MTYASQQLHLGQIYSRANLANLFGLDPAHPSFRAGVYRLPAQKSIWLFITRIKPADVAQHNDRFEGNVLYWEGQESSRTDRYIVNHKTSGDELLVFFRDTKTQHPGSGFRYLGRFEYVSHTGATPAHFILKSLDDAAALAEAPAVTSLPAVQPGAKAVLDLAKVHQSFGQALKDSHVHFGARHDELARSFVTALATKRFAILTGLSGSGKTQIALRLGDWFGPGRHHLEPVRPDWTGSEALFGYEDALQEPADDGRRSWHVPAVLAFMLRAAKDSQNPYLLILDEMNLAHVERYFADVLSGMESAEGCLPNLREEDKLWRRAPGQDPKIAFPSNLFIVGTVNVDETTYMFSPKVLDRANTFEFRVDSEDLLLDAQKPVSCKPGPAELVRGFLQIAEDQNWHLEHRPDWLEEFAKQFKVLHKLLSAGGFEFGHRVFYEAIRFAALLAEAGGNDLEHALDLQIMQKVLPRLYGTRRRLEPTLCALGQFCYDMTYVAGPKGSSEFDPMEEHPNKPKLPLAFDKVQRMTDTLRANQFASFTE